MPTQKYFNRLFSVYAPAYHLVSRLFNRSRRQQILLLESLTAKDGNLLMIGGGDGNDIPFFPNSYNITYLDAAVGMYKMAKNKFENMKNVNFVHADINDFKSNIRFDLICLHFCLSTTANPQKVIEKACDLLSPTGVLSVLDVAKPYKFKGFSLVNFILSKTVSDFKLDVIKLTENQPLSLLSNNRLQEAKFYKSFIFQRVETSKFVLA